MRKESLEISALTGYTNGKKSEETDQVTCLMKYSDRQQYALVKIHIRPQMC